MLDAIRTGVLGRVYRRARRTFSAPSPALPLKGYHPGGPFPLLDRLSDSELKELNGILDWNCFIADGLGRRFGKNARAGKRELPQQMPDRRVKILTDRFRVADKHVLEVGCFEGVHTAGLCQVAREVTGVDSRLENIVKAMVRTSFLGVKPRLFPCDLEKRPLPVDLLKADVLFHVGVLYHLADPVRHLREMAPLISTGILLDTHVATDEEAVDSYVVDGETFRYCRYEEYGKAEVFSGMSDHSKWLTLDTLKEVLAGAGFPAIEVVEVREERHGRRILLTAGR